MVGHSYLPPQGLMQLVQMLAYTCYLIFRCELFINKNGTNVHFAIHPLYFLYLLLLQLLFSPPFFLTLPLYSQTSSPLSSPPLSLSPPFFCPTRLVFAPLFLYTTRPPSLPSRLPSHPLPLSLSLSPSLPPSLPLKNNVGSVLMTWY